MKKINTMTSFDFNGLPIVLTDTMASTNNYASTLISSGAAKDGSIVLTFRQTKGRGYGNNVWESEDFMNLTFSLILFPGFLPASRQFLLSQVVSLGLASFLGSKTDDVHIKWPNDILIGGKKAAGILIENSISGNFIASTIIGIGLNINQSRFSAHLPNATSLRMVTGKEHPLDESLKNLYREILQWYDILKGGGDNEIEKSYLRKLFRYGTVSNFRTADRNFEATIRGTDEYGQLLLEESTGGTKAWPFKSVVMIY
jgi:BirA family biotin operon repressor/biotin-[acetyl-CoA-carboxylase] ligase